MNHGGREGALQPLSPQAKYPVAIHAGLRHHVLQKGRECPARDKGKDKATSKAKEANQMAEIIKRFLKRTSEFRALRKEARDAFADYADGAETEFTIMRLAGIGRRMDALTR